MSWGPNRGLVHLSAAKAQQDEETIQKLTRLEAEVRQKYYNFRGRVGGEELSDNRLDDILAKSGSSAEVREAWEASKQIGAEVDGQVRELARVRNSAARAQGFRDHFQRSLALDEIDEAEMFSLFDSLEQATRVPFEELKKGIDRERARHFGIEVNELRPWHYGDRFFQAPPQTGEVYLDALFNGKDPAELAKATYDGLGMEVRDILERSIYARQEKPTLFSDLDRKGISHSQNPTTIAGTRRCSTNWGTQIR
jgi:peptidyl-dipeptidase A